MSKQVDLTKPLSESDLRYLVDRDMWDEIRENAANLGLPEPTLPSVRGLRKQVPRFKLPRPDSFNMIAEQLQVPTEDPEDEEVVVPPANSADGDGSTDYTKLTVPQLKEVMDQRRREYEAGGDAEGVELMTYKSDAKKDDLVAALQMDDEEDSDDGDES